MSTYGLSISDTSGTERLRFSDPITAIYVFTVSGSGSLLVPGCHDHAVLTVSPAVAILAPGYHTHIVVMDLDDVITWYSDPYTITTTLVFVNFIK